MTKKELETALAKADKRAVRLQKENSYLKRRLVEAESREAEKGAAVVMYREMYERGLLEEIEDER